MPTPKSQALLIPGTGAGPANPNGLLPAIQKFGPLGGGLLVLVILGLLGGFLVGKRNKKLGSTSGSDLLPAIQRGGHESATIAVHDGTDLGGGMESATMTVHDAGDLNGELGNHPTIDWGDKDPGGAALNEKPPSPNLPGGSS